MASRGKTDAADLGHRIWQHLRTQAEQDPAQFPADRRFGADGWRWEGSIVTLIREAAPDAPEADVRRARAHLDASGMLVNVRGSQRGGVRPQWFIRAEWDEGTGGHVRMRESEAQQAATAEPEVDRPGEPAGEPLEDIVEALSSLIDRVTALQSERDRLSAENSELRRQALWLQAENGKLTETAEIARRAAELLSRLRD